MTCSPELLAAYLDGELDATQIATVEQHLSGCQNCSEEYARLLQQKEAIRQTLPYYNAPPELHQSVRKALRELERKPAPRELPWRWMSIAASLLLAVSVSWNLVQLRSRSKPDLAESAASNHIRSLLGSRMVDVVSSDQHTVKPWFIGKLDFAPDVKDLAAQGFPLAGGRVDYLDGRRVAALVYYRRKHVINLFIWPSDGADKEKSVTSRDGFNIVSWTKGPLSYLAVSDVSAPDLEAFRGLFK